MPTKPWLKVFVYQLVAITALFSVLASVPVKAAGENLILNPSFEDSVASPSMPDNWYKGGWGTNTIIYSYPVAGYNDAKAAKVQITSYANGDAKWYFKSVPVVAGATYAFSDYYLSDVPSSLVAQIETTAGNYSYLWLKDLPASASWAQAQTNIAIPANAKAISVFHLISSIGSLTVDNFGLSSGTAPAPTPPPTADTVPPIISIASPLSNAMVSGTLAITANATDNVGVTGVQFMIDGANLGAEDVASPYSISWNSTQVADGQHSITARARDGAGNATYTSAIAVTVQNTATPPPPPTPTPTPTDPNNIIANPSVETATSPAIPDNWLQNSWGTNQYAFTYPVAGYNDAKAVKVQITSYSSGDAKWYFKSVPVTAGATYSFTDYYTSNISSSLVAQVESQTGTYTYIWIKDLPASANWVQAQGNIAVPTNAKNMTIFHLISGVGTLTTDNFSLTTGTVTPPPPTADTVPPIISIASPLSNAMVSGTLAITANATDNVGVTGVQFMIDGANLGAEDVASPYSISWNSTQVADGQHSITARARDGAGNATYTSAIAVTVQNTATPPPPPPPTEPGNLVANPSLETAASPAMPDSWVKDSWGTNQSAFTFPVAGYNSAKAAKVQITSYANGDAKWFFDPVAVSPGVEYVFTDFYTSNIANSLVAQIELTNGTYSYLWMKDLQPATNWTQAQAKITAPTNAKSMTVFHLIAKVGTLTVDTYSLAKFVPSPLTQAMVSLNFDDGFASVYENALPILDKAGIKSTQAIISGTFDEQPMYMTRAQIQEFYAKGHEIASHTRTHADLNALTATQMKNEITGSRNDLLALNAGPISSFVFPYGEYNDTALQIIKDSGFTNARSVNEGYNDKNSDFYLLEDQHVLNTTTVAQVKGWIDNAIANKTWLILELHSTDYSNDEYSHTPETLQAIVDYIKQTGIKTVTNAEGTQILK